MNLTAVHTVRIARDLVGATERQLQEAGRQGAERFVLWTGHVVDGRFHVDRAHVPEQTAYRLPEGLCVHVDGPALHRLNDWLYDNGQRLAVQVHAHPDRAYHSDTDDAYPIVTSLGGISIVAPDFCARGLLGAGCVAYRLTHDGWQRSRVPVTQLLEVL